MKETMRYKLYFWREEGPIEPAADSVLDRLTEDRNLPGVDRLSLATISDVFGHHFPEIAITDRGMQSEADGCSFQVSFRFDDSNQPIIVCVSSASPLHETPGIFARVFEVVRELGCTKVESAIR